MTYTFNWNLTLKTKAIFASHGEKAAKNLISGFMNMK